jgi:hypothetical protein
MIASDIPGRFLLRQARLLVAGAAVVAWAGCEPNAAREFVQFDGSDLATLAQTSDDRADARARETVGVRLALADPRNDPVTLAWAVLQLEPGRWREGYATLVETAALGPRIAWQGGGRTGAGLQYKGGSARPGVGEQGVDTLIAELLGATLVDAQDELWTAWKAFARAGYPEPARKWLTEPPPWPPASIEKYLRREGENSMALIETLAAELAPTPSVRAWLVRSWLSPARPMDETLLTELALAAKGQLGAEPRLRAWLRAEWTASARQRYRRVARLAAIPQPHAFVAEISGVKP